MRNKKEKQKKKKKRSDFPGIEWKKSLIERDRESVGYVQRKKE